MPHRNTLRRNKPLFSRIRGVFWWIEYKPNTEKNIHMITGATFEKMALSFPNTGQKPHVERIGFNVVGRRMFATYLDKDNTANIFLTPKEQAVFCEMDTANIYPVANKWGEGGVTTFNLNKVSIEFVQEALLSAYNEVIKKKPGNK